MDNLLIVGIDPGTTVGFAVLDIEGKIIRTVSGKDLTLSKIIFLAEKFGKPLLVGTDKAKVPSFVQDFASKFGAKIVHPRLDLSVDEKRNLVSNSVANAHESDALASSVFAFRSVAPLLKKINFFLKENNKQELSDKVKRLVILKNFSIKQAVDFWENPKTRFVEPVFKEVKKPEVNVNLLLETVKKLETENVLVKNQNNSLKEDLKKLSMDYEVLLRKLESFAPSAKARKQLGFKESNIVNLNKEIQLKDLVNKKLNEKLGRLMHFLSLSDVVVLKHLRNLSWEEFIGRNKILDIKENDFLLVDDVNVYSQKTLDFLKGKNIFVVYKSNGKQNLRLNLINASRLSIDESDFFAVVKKTDFELEKRNLNIIEDLVKEYRKKDF